MSAEAMAKFRQWLNDRTSRCAVCLNDEVDVRFWRDHPVLGRVFVCKDCIVVRTPPANEYGIGALERQSPVDDVRASGGQVSRAQPYYEPIVVGVG